MQKSNHCTIATFKRNLPILYFSFPGIPEVPTPMYDFYCGKDGVNETTIISNLHQQSDFIFDPFDDDEGVAIRDFYLLDHKGKKIDVEALEHRRVFLHGKIHSWTSPKKAMIVGNIGPLEAW